MKMKCIDSMNSGYELTRDKIYDITKVDESYYWTINDGGDFTYFNKDRFEKVKENDLKMSNKEQLLNELEQIKIQQKELDEKLENIQKKIETKNNKKERWIPKKYDKYYVPSVEGNISEYSYADDEIDEKIINNLNYYQTKEQAERQAFEQLLHRKLEIFADLNNTEEIDWSNDDSKYNIWYDYQEKHLDTGCYEVARDFGQIFFSSEGIAEKAIEEFKDELLRYFTSDK